MKTMRFLLHAILGRKSIGMAGKEETTRFYRLFYWSTRQKGDISEPYGQNDYTDRAAMEQSRDQLKESRDMYRIEMWQRVEVWIGPVHVEEYHGNTAHLRVRQREKGEPWL